MMRDSRSVEESSHKSLHFNTCSLEQHYDVFLEEHLQATSCFESEVWKCEAWLRQNPKNIGTEWYSSIRPNRNPSSPRGM